VKVVIVCAGRFVAFDIARELARREMLGGLVTAYGLAPREGVDARFLRWAPWLDAAARVERRLALAPVPELDWRAASRFGRWAARRLPRGDVAQLWSGYAQESLPAARRAGMTTVVLRGSAHIATQAELLQSEFAQYGLCAPAVSPRMIAREEREYAEADYVHVISTFARRTFLERGFAPERLILTPLGVDVAEVRPLARPESPGGPLRALFLGTVSIQKGVHYLLRAARMLGAEQVRVSLVGGVSADGLLVLDREGGRPAYRGKSPRAGLRSLFAEHDVLVLPSIQDGFGSVIVEAMAAGLPVIASINTGGPDVIESGRTGFLVPPGSAEALADALHRLAANRALCVAMGAAAAEAVRGARTWQHFVDDLVAQYTVVRRARSDTTAPAAERGVTCAS
jgi:glycosyltransferase involved in cell wall biosynthesis